MTLKPLCSKTHLFLYPSPLPLYSIIVSRFSTSSRVPTDFQSSQQDESRNVKVSVWWDFENCNLPNGVNVFKVAHAITSAIRVNGIKGPIQITAFGDVVQLSRANQEALSSTGIHLSHVPQGGKNSADRSLLVDLMYWVSQNPPPAHLFLISSDRDFSSVLHKLRMNNYNVLLASTDTAPSVLCSAASIMWRWNALVRGETLTGKVFNQPPDGPYGSWYGHYKVPLENPFLVEQTSPQVEGLAEANSDNKVHPVPKAVIKQIRDILSLYPKGISITDLRAELGKSNVCIDRNFYGHKKFSSFLFSMPDILELHSIGAGQFRVRGIITKPEPFEPNPCMSTGPVIDDGNQSPAKSIKPNGEQLPISASIGQKPIIPSSPKISTEASTRIFQKSPPSVEKAIKMDIEQPSKEMGEPHSIAEDNAKAINSQVARENLPPAESEVGFFKKIWRRWLSGIDDSSGIKCYDIPHASNTSQNNAEKKSENTLENCGASTKSLEKKEVEKFAKSPDPENGLILSTSGSLSNGESTRVKEIRSSEPSSEKSEESPGYINLIKKLIWGNGVNSNSFADQPSGELKDINSYSGMHEMLCDDSFWRDMESFFDSQKGLLVVSQSKTRLQMATNLQKDGPLVLRHLDESDILQLVDVLIFEKKWVEYYPSEASPFKLTRSVEKETSLGVSRTPNGLRSIFLRTEKRPAEPDGDGRMGKFPNVSHAGVSQPLSCKRPSERSKEETLINCEKLVEQVLKEFPRGYRIGSFRKLFVEKYGYPLDIQKLGYQKLASLLGNMPGVKVESIFILPSSKTPKCSIQDSDVPNVQDCNISYISAALGGELSDASKDDESDSTWDELGPVDNSISKGKQEQNAKGLHPHYEPSVSDDDVSDSDGETFAVTQPEGQAKSSVNSEDGSLIRILDSWYSSDECVKEKSEKLQDMVDIISGLQPSDSSGIGTITGTSLGKYGSKQRPQKRNSFVAVPDGDGSDDDHSNANKPKNNSNANERPKLFDSILGSLKKSDETAMRS